MSSRQVVVTGIGLRSALGNLGQTWQQLLWGQSAIALLQPFPEIQPLPLAMLGKHPANLTDLVRQVTAEALEDANLSVPLADCGVVIGSSRSHQAQWEQLARRGGHRHRHHDSSGLDSGNGTKSRTLGTQPNFDADDPNRQPWNPDAEEQIRLEDWLQTLPSQPAIAVGQFIQTQAPVQAPMAACATGLWAVIQGYELIQTGQCDRVLVGAAETPITPLTLAGFGKMGALAATGCYPFDRRREGLVLGEGAAVLVLEAAEAAAQRQVTPYGQILGGGLTADGHHVSAPDSNCRAAIAAIQQCLQRSGRRAAAVDYIHAHGTSTRLNDRHEAQLIQRLFSSQVAVSSTKGATGHSLGASGALGIAFALLALRHQTLPPCVGLTMPEFALNLVQQETVKTVETALCFSFGFGGQNAVVAVGKT
jgi:3-oxoacyl-[acyl-carrier-protein] synthase II